MTKCEEYWTGKDWELSRNPKSCMKKVIIQFKKSALEELIMSVNICSFSSFPECYLVLADLKPPGSALYNVYVAIV